MACIQVKKIVFTLIGFVVFWAVITNAWGYSDHIFQNDPYNIGAYIYGYISRIIWVIPAVGLIVKYDNRLKISKKELFSWSKFNKPLLFVMTMSFAYAGIGMLVSHKGFWFNSDIYFSFVCIKYAIVGMVEEIVFRGWGYNSLANIVSHKKAALLTTVLFIVLHWPAYVIRFFRSGVFDLAGMIGQSSSALIWGFVCCWLLKKEKTIWDPIIAHTAYDLLYVLLVGGN